MGYMILAALLLFSIFSTIVYTGIRAQLESDAAAVERSKP